MPVFVHISDTHLGFNDLDTVDTSGINIREADVYHAFEHAVDTIVAMKPDFVLHTGDLFHRASPSNRALIQGLNQIKRITQAGIPFIVIAGNHCTPRTIYTSPILQALQTIEGVFAVYSQRYEYVTIDGIHIHCLPHIHDDMRYVEQIRTIEPKQGCNILLMHTSVGQDYLLDEYGERIFPAEYYHLFNAFDYVALGHWHNFKVLPPWDTVCYSGSTERFSDREAGREKGFLTVTIAQNKNITFNAIPIRPWVRFDIPRCSELSIDDIKTRIKHFSSQVEDGSIVSIYLHDVDTHQSAGISSVWITRQFENAMAVIPKRIFKKQGGDSYFQSEHVPVDELFVQYCNKAIADEKERALLVERGRRYFRNYYDRVDGKGE